MPRRRTKIDPHIIKEIQILWKFGWPCAKIARRYKTTPPSVRYHTDLIPQYTAEELLELENPLHYIQSEQQFINEA